MSKKKKRSSLIFLLAATSLFGMAGCNSESGISKSLDSSTTSEEKASFKITFESNDNFTITALEGYDPLHVVEGKEFKFRVIAKEGYRISSVAIAGESYSLLPDEEGVYVLENVTKNIVLSVQAEVATYRISFVGKNFSWKALEGFDATKVLYGSDFKFKLTADEHFNIKDVLYKGEPLVAQEEGVYTISNVKENVSISVNTEIDSFAIAFNGNNFVMNALEGFDATKVPYGSDFKFKLTPDTRYFIKSVALADGNVLTPDEEGVYTISNVTENKTINVVTEIKTYAVTFTGENFSWNALKGYDAGKVAYGDDFKFTIAANEHATLKSVAIGVDVLTPVEGVYTISNITSNVEVSVVVEEDTYSLSIPTGSTYSVLWKEEGLNFAKLPYSKELKFKITPVKYYSVKSVKIGTKVLEADAEGYYTFKNGEGSLELLIETERAKYTLSFDSCGGSAISPVTVNGGETASEPTAPTREADEYYDSYAFDGWYLDNEKFDFSKPLEGNVTLIAKWVYGNSKTAYVSDAWKKENFVATTETEGKSSTIQTISAAASQFAWVNGAVDADLKAQYIADFGKTDDDGVMWMRNAGDARVTLPAIDFKGLLKTHSEVVMEVGCWQKDNQLFYVNGETSTKITNNSTSDKISQIQSLTRSRLVFSLNRDGKVAMGFEDATYDTPLIYDAHTKSGSVLISEKQANGEEGLEFAGNETDYTRHYWFGRPYVFAGEGTFKNVSGKTGFSVAGATAMTQGESASLSSKAPYGQWKTSICFDEMGVGLLGDDKGPAVLSLDPIDFKSLFASQKGVSFTLGAWNGNEPISFVDKGEAKTLGKNWAKPDNNAATLTRERMAETWFNWEISVDPVNGLLVHNVNEGQEYSFKLTDGQLGGTESLVFHLGNISNGRFFLLTNLLTYRI